jgi:hypothetical protein
MFKKIISIALLCVLFASASFAGTRLVDTPAFNMYDGNKYYTDSFELTSRDKIESFGTYSLQSYYNIRCNTSSWDGGATLYVDLQKLVNGRWTTVSSKSTGFDKFDNLTISRGLYDPTTQPSTAATYRLKLRSYGEKILIRGMTLDRKFY